MRRFYAFVVTLTLTFSHSIEAQIIRYLALGDSYTIGEGVAEADCYPVQLSGMLLEEGFEMAAPQIIARTGWTTDELMKGIEAAAPQGPFDLVTLLIGVNNQYRGRSTEQFGQEFNQLLSIAIEFAGGNPDRVFVISIPDWGVTPFAENRNTNIGKVAGEIDRFNEVKEKACKERGIRFFNITPHYRQHGYKEVVSDKLHPSPMIYRHWASFLAPEVIHALREK